jgi:predicted nuclease of predicted toxin-antitoxin system
MSKKSRIFPTWPLSTGFTPPKRKLPLCIDRDIPNTITSAIDQEAGFKIVSRAEHGMDDLAVWRMAIKAEAVLLTHDEHFWDDRRYPLRESPGVIVVKGATEREIGLAINDLLATWPFTWLERVAPGAFWHSKIKASMEGFVLRYIGSAGSPRRISVEYGQQRSVDELVEAFLEAIAA